MAEDRWHDDTAAPSGIVSNFEEHWADAAYLNSLEAKITTAREALEAAAEKFQRIQWIALPSTMIMARAVDGEDEARATLAALEVAEKKATINVNDEVWVALTPYGEELWAEQWNETSRILDGNSGVPDSIRKSHTETSGLIRFQWWDLMRTFGQAMFMGNPRGTPFVGNRISLSSSQG